MKWPTRERDRSHSRPLLASSCIVVLRGSGVFAPDVLAGPATLLTGGVGFTF